MTCRKAGDKTCSNILAHSQPDFPFHWDLLDTYHSLIRSACLNRASYDTYYRAYLKTANATKPVTHKSSKETSEKSTGKENALNGSNDIVRVTIAGRCRIRIKIQA